jgi:putative phosphoribosyl transferase
MEDREDNASPTSTATLHISAGPRSIHGELVVPPAAEGVILVLASGPEGEHARATSQLLKALQKARFATLLLPIRERAVETHIAPEQSYVHRRVQQLLVATEWLAESDVLAGLPLGYLGLDTDSVAAIHAAGAQPSDVGAVVMIDGILDVAASDLLERVAAPALLVAGSELSARRDASGCALLCHLHCPHELARVAGVRHPLQSPEAAAETARLASSWFGRHFAALDPTLRAADRPVDQPRA